MPRNPGEFSEGANKWQRGTIRTPARVTKGHWRNGTENCIQCKQLQMWQPFITLASVRKLPSARFPTWPQNREFFRRGFLAVGCRCFAAAGAERKDVDGKMKSTWIRKAAQSDQHWAQMMPRATEMEPNGCWNESKGDQNTCWKKFAKRRGRRRKCLPNFDQKSLKPKKITIQKIINKNDRVKTWK